MRAVIMSVEGKNAVALTSGGDFKKIRNKGYNVGDKIKITANYASRISAAAAAAVFIIGGSASYFIPASYVRVDINPSFLMTLNIFDKVIDVEPLNDEAENILRYTDIKGKNINDTVETLIDESERIGYIKEAGGEVRMSVVSGIKTPKIEDKNTGGKVNFIVSDTDKRNGRTVKEIIDDTKREEKTHEKDSKPSAPPDMSDGASQSAPRSVQQNDKPSVRSEAPGSASQTAPQTAPRNNTPSDKSAAAPKSAPQNVPKNEPRHDSVALPQNNAPRPMDEPPEIAAPPKEKLPEAHDVIKDGKVHTEDRVKNENPPVKEESAQEKPVEEKPVEEEPVREHRSGRGSSRGSKPSDADKPPQDDIAPKKDNEPSEDNINPPRENTEGEQPPSDNGDNAAPEKEAPSEEKTPHERDHEPINNTPQEGSAPPQENAPRDSAPQDDKAPSDGGNVPQNNAPQDSGSAPHGGEAPSDGGMDRR